MNPEVDEYLNNAKKWQKELKKLRMIILDCQLTEEFKWRNPCYTFDNKNIVLIGAFKDNSVLSFFKGVLLNDKQNILVQAGDNTQSARIIKFSNVQQIEEMESVLKVYIKEAIEIEKAGLKVAFKKTSEYVIPEELQNKLDEDSAFKTAFEALTPGRQRGYILHFSAPKQSKTRESRIEKYMDRIFDGKGLYDCVCGLSKRMPSCDGTHKHA